MQQHAVTSEEPLLHVWVIESVYWLQEEQQPPCSPAHASILYCMMFDWISVWMNGPLLCLLPGRFVVVLLSLCAVKQSVAGCTLNRLQVEHAYVLATSECSGEEGGSQVAFTRRRCDFAIGCFAMG